MYETLAEACIPVTVTEMVSVRGIDIPKFMKELVQMMA
jgi:hypothetical protein